MKIIAIANQKGGVGKTTTAVNLGCALAEEGLRVLIIDLDPQGNATSSFGLQELEGESLYEPLLGAAAIADKVVPTRVERVFVVPADLDLAGAEVEIARLDNHLTRLAETLAPLRADNTFDFVLLDCPPSLGILMTNALAAADDQHDSLPGPAEVVGRVTSPLTGSVGVEGAVGVPVAVHLREQADVDDLLRMRDRLVEVQDVAIAMAAGDPARADQLGPATRRG